MTEIKKIQNKINEIIYNQAGDIAADNGFSADLQTSLKVYHLWKLALQENKLLILHAGHSYRLSKKEYGWFESRAVVNASLSKATQDICEDIESQIQEAGHDDYEARGSYIEGISLLEVNDNEIIIELLSGS